MSSSENEGKRSCFNRERKKVCTDDWIGRVVPAAAAKGEKNKERERERERERGRERVREEREKGITRMRERGSPL
jgi:hypothetical protein